MTKRTPEIVAAIRRLALPFCLILLLVVPSWGQNEGVRGPLSGIVFDSPSQSIRPIMGVPGAAYLGKPIVNQIEFASVSPDGDAALVVSEGQSKLARGLNAGSSMFTLIEGLPGTPDETVWAPDASAVVAYYASTRQFFRVTLSSDQPLVASPLDASSLPGELRGMAVCEKDGPVLAGVRGADVGGLYQLLVNAPPILVAPMGDPAAIVAAKGGGTVYAVDAGARLVVEIRDAANVPQVMPIIGEPDDRFDPVGLALDRRGRFLFVANASSRTVFVYDLASRTRIGEFATEAVPGPLKPLPGSSLFLFANRREAGEPVWILDATDTGSVYFIPDGGQE